MKRNLKTPRYHPELSLPLELQRGTAETFLKSLIKNQVDLSNAGKYVKESLLKIK